MYYVNGATGLMNQHYKQCPTPRAEGSYIAFGNSRGSAVLTDNAN